MSAPQKPQQQQQQGQQQQGQRGPRRQQQQNGASPSPNSGAVSSKGPNSRSPSPTDNAAAAAAGGVVGAGDETRLLVDWHHVGAIIGKGGQSVKQIREESGCAINIIAPAPNAPSPQQIDRIMSIRGSVEQSTKAVFLIAHTIQARAAERKAAGQDETSGRSRAGGREMADGSTAIKLLVHRAAVGAVIGKGGDAIRQTQAETGARIQVSSEPLGGSTDKTVTISGTPEIVEAAVGKVLLQLAESPLRTGTKTVHFVPGPAFYEYAPDGSQMQQQGGHPGQQQHMQHQQAPQQQQLHPQHLAQQGLPVGAGGAQGSSASGPISIQKIAIPTICAGCVIGRSGSIIRELRAQSGTNISIADPDPATPDERVVTITGSPQGIQTAVYLIRQCVEAYVPPSHQQGGQQGQQGGDDGAPEQHDEQAPQQQDQQQSQQTQQ